MCLKATAYLLGILKADTFLENNTVFLGFEIFLLGPSFFKKIYVFLHKIFCKYLPKVSPDLSTSNFKTSRGKFQNE